LGGTRCKQCRPCRHSRKTPIQPLKRGRNARATHPHARTVLTALAASNVRREWPGMTLEDLVNRVVVETGGGYASLIADLRGARVPSSIAN